MSIKIRMKKIYIFCIFFVVKSTLFAQILGWQFGTPASLGNEATYTATTINANLNTSALSRGSGVSASALVRGFSSTNFPVSGTKADAITNNRFFSFTVNALSGFQASLSTLNVRLRRTSTGPSAFIWRYSVDGTMFTDIGTDISFTSTVDGVDQAQIDLSVLPALQNVSSVTTITFRLYAWGANATTGTFVIGRYGTAITTNSLAIGGTVTPASTNSTNSDIIADGTFVTPTNINYSLYQGTVLTLANSVEIARFTIRDGGGVADADGVGTTLNSISFSLSNSANIRRVAIMDGTTQLQEVAGAATINFTGLNIVAADDGSKNFSLRVIFVNNVTDNQQYQFTITSVTADVAGSQFAASNAGGATSSIAGDNNRIEVIADGLSYVANTFSPTGNGVAMAPAVQVAGTDTLNFGGNLYTNVDADFNQDIAITSTGTLTGTPVILSPTAGIAAFTTLTHTINGTALTLTAKRNTTNDWDAVSNPFDIINSSNTTDYFRSVQNGNWNNPTTWESSPDNIGWQASTLTPNSLANTITIRNTDTVTITTNTDADQLSIENGGKLIQNNTPIFTINNGTAPYDMTVEIGGTFEMNGRQPVGAGSIIIAGGGRIRVASNPSPSEGDDFAFGNVGGVASVTFLNASFYDWATTTTPSWSNRTYFTSGNNTYFTFLVTPGFSLGGNSPTVINGTLVANDTITIANTGAKTFVNGIINAALIDASFTTGGSLNITGTVAALGDTGTILLPPAGLNIGASTVIGCTTNPATPTKTINGNVNFSVNSYLFLTDTDLTITGNITGISSTAFFITNGLSNTGKLFRPNIGVTPVSFPIGFNATSYNPVIIANGSNLNYGAKVFDGIVPTPIFDNTKAVNRTWLLLPSGIPAGAVDVTFSYGPGEGNTNFNYTSNVELGLYTGVWNIIQTGILPTGTYNVTAAVSAFGTGIEAPMVIGNLGAILSVQKFIHLTAVNQNNAVNLNWITANIATVKQFIIEYSINGINYFPIATKNSSTFSFVDDRPLNQKNYYRIKGIGLNNSIVYSNIISINSNSLTSVFLTPCSTTSSITLNANSNKQQTVQLVLLDAVGKQLEQQTTPLAIGQNRILKNVAYLSKGIYYMVVYYSNGDKTTLRFVKM